MRAVKICLILSFSLLLGTLKAQYFGQNKPSYESFDFEVLQTRNFEIYHYLKNEKVLRSLANYSEQWYLMHQNVLRDTIKSRNPMIFYSDHADFQQTNAISGAIGVGTGGVTEGLRNRVVMPIAMSNQQTFHVLGHELVHAFQYNMIINGDSTSLRNLANIPLWMVEGLAEYMSIGRVDANTAMWMRDAIVSEDVPPLDKLNNPKYFPYRYGQAFWAFLTGLKGDDIIQPFFEGVAKYGFEDACIIVLGMSSKNLSDLWVRAIKNHFGKTIEGRKENTVGQKLIHPGNSGRLNIAPIISPNGRYVIFLSERDLFSTDLFLADARTGEVIRKVASAARDGHIDDFNYIESAGTWSPDSERFAFVAFKKGYNVLVIKDVESGKTLDEIEVKEVPAMSNPNWSPDGNTIVFTGLADGQIDLYGVNVKTQRVTQYTDDEYSELHPYWYPDGSGIVFATDQLSMERGRNYGKWTTTLATIDVLTGSIEHHEVFYGADNLNPIVDENGDILFLSNRDGFRNIYRYEPGVNKVYQLTDFVTGVSSITPYSPAISVAKRTGRIMYNHYARNAYSVYKAKPEAFLDREVPIDSVDMTAATLPRVDETAINIVDAQLYGLDSNDPAGRMTEAGTIVEARKVDYKSKFELSYIGGGAGVGVGVGNNNFFSAGRSQLVGGVSGLFTDIIGNNQLFASLAMNGEFEDIGGGLTYINQKSRVNWGGSLSHIPIRRIFYNGTNEEILDLGDGQATTVLVDNFVTERIFQDQLSVFAQLPFSRAMRVEASASAALYNFSQVLDKQIYSAIPQGDFLFRGFFLGSERERLDAPDGFSLFNVSGALVGDNSSFGLTAPLRGYRYRLGYDRYLGEFNFHGVTADFRKYQRLKPVSLAFRAYHYGRYGGNGNNLFPLFLGNPWFVRGYSSNNIERVLTENGDNINQLAGSKILVGNFEVRIPFTGPRQLALIKSGLLFSDLNFFFDAGVAWFDFDQFQESNETGFFDVLPVYSAGVSLRVNLFGAMVLEPYYAFPLIENGEPTFGINILPGW